MSKTNLHAALQEIICNTLRGNPVLFGVNLRVHYHTFLMTIRERTSALVAAFKRELERIYGLRLKGVFLYGSYAREQASPESDVDVIVVLDDWQQYAAEVDRVGLAVSELSLNYNMCISPVFVRQRDWLQGDTPFLANAREDAIPA